MTVANPRYALPNKHHDVVDDINNLRTTLRTVDADIHSVEEAIPALSDRVPEVQDTVLCVESNLANSEIQNIEANRYLVVNRNGDGFECVESGGEPGGKTGQCSIKKSDKNVDIAWGNILDVSKNGMTIQENAETGKKNETHIFVDETEIENSEQLPRVNLTNCQILSDTVLDSNSSVIVCDEIEKVEESLELATNQNYGFVKVGYGFTNNEGTISAQIVPVAEEDSVGIIKAGNGLDVENGVISRADIDPATFSKYGVVKFGHNLSSNQNGEMEINEMANAATIYNLGHIKVCNNGIVELEEATLHYRMFVTEDLLIQFIIDFVVLDDFSFVLELVSDGTHLVAFNENLNPKMNTLPINKGTTKITFTKKLGMPFYEVVVSRLDCPEPQLLTPRDKVLISDNVRVTCPKGSNWIPWEIIRDYCSGWSNTPCVRFEFTTLVCVEYVQYMSDYRDEPMTEFSVRASMDGKNWATLIYKANEIIEEKVYTDIKGCFRIFEINIGYNNNRNKPCGVTLWGTQIDNNESEITLLTPYMSSNISDSVTMTANNITDGSAANLTDTNCDSLLKMNKTGDDWIKYEFAEAKIANLLELHFRGTGEYYGFYGDRHPNWFKLEGSNDDENWTLLLERCHLGSYWAYDNNVVFFDFNNDMAYKYYKFTCLGTNSTSSQWGLSGFKLYRQSIGKHNFYRGVPKLSSANQDGYEVTVSSQCDGGHAGYLAFDDNTQTRWASVANEGNSWLQVKLPTAMAFNVVKIAPRGDGYIDQAPSAFQIQGSNDGENWDVLDSETDVLWATLGELRLFRFENETAYLYYRLYITASQGSAYNGCSCFILGRTSYEYKRYLDKYDYIVPVMSANSQDGYIVSASSNQSNYFPYKAFDRVNNVRNDSWCSSNRLPTVNDPQWIQIQLPTAQICNVMQIAAPFGQNIDPNCGPSDFVLKGSNDGETWTDIHSETDQVYSSTNLKTYTFDNSNAYLYYRLVITKVLETANWAYAGMSVFNLMNHSLVSEY